jgi:hypothetical protein
MMNWFNAMASRPVGGRSSEQNLTPIDTNNNNKNNATVIILLALKLASDHGHSGNTFLESLNVH